MIDLDAVADAVAGLVIDGGEKAISIVGAAERLDVSRATLYRLVPTKEDLVGIMFERATRQQTEVMSEVVESEMPVRDRLIRLIEMQVEAAVRMRGYMPVFFGGDGLPSDVFQRWHAWSREYEATWNGCVEEAMAQGVLERADVGTTTRLLLGMCLWVSRWYRPEEGIEVEHIARVAVSLILPESS
ncbi:TetR/AcrR family transcriptional regulator [Mycobacterium sp. CVI_P3]|uniref:TetR/AcrR family transcriptional regulator n=1 Tax=Mycobacterium pinniadriaticum TaxID=2994102 RepID=A0ABT3SBE7_9MYCO|nr:TetR/AcrR family transcriptional regulator [Mycobacterium pinniadriaticum]MCX2930101.1 TetR/AcrR family transcriptional regulator [Mycobacterium pinniadriaticum]MCX2936250.1 TetR/AcrR family transcriptional regulator [Mycobacterium pinniadriaticum]